MLRVSLMVTLVFVQFLHSPFVQAHSPWLDVNEGGTATIVDQFDDLPFEITSFGAARVGDRVFVYGGHTGTAHSYSTEEQSNQLLALNLLDPKATWQVVSKGERLQGLAMVAHQDSVVLVGGFTARNAEGEEQDLHSQAAVRAFDTKQNSWSDLPALPQGRSSHDAAILDDVIYVVGGWEMKGDAETEWHTTALKLDLNASDPKWQEIETPPFQRRALATIAHRGKLYVVGGMSKNGGPTRAVSVYDPKKNAWSETPELAGSSPMAGFGAAGWSVGDKLIVSTYEGAVLELADSDQTWKSLGKTEDSRFFHRLLPLDSRRLISLGGANMEAGKYLNLEVIEVN